VDKVSTPQQVEERVLSITAAGNEMVQLGYLTKHLARARGAADPGARTKIREAADGPQHPPVHAPIKRQFLALNILGHVPKVKTVIQLENYARITHANNWFEIY